MTDCTPTSAKELAAALQAAGAGKQQVIVRGAGSKARMGGPAGEAELVVSTTALNRILQYEPKDLTLSVEAGVRWADLTAALAAERQMLPLDPPCAAEATVGGVIMTNSCGPRRRQYGSARDMVIGMSYATLHGDLAECGGMVVKNVAGLDVQKALIGSFGTLAVAVAINFKLAPLPEATRSFALDFPTAQAVTQARDRILGGALQPTAIDVLSPPAAGRCGLKDWCLLVRASGGAALLDRYQLELSAAAVYEGECEKALWTAVEEFAPAQRYVLKAAHPLTALESVLTSADTPIVARAGTGATYLAFEERGAAIQWWNSNAASGWARVVEWSAGDLDEYWAAPGQALEWMKRLKSAFDPAGLLNRGRLHGRI
jgi:glycolate oxidase FAD binding subunit